MSSKSKKVANFFAAELAGMDQFEVSHRIGKGSYGTVCAGRSRVTGEKVAIKHIDRVFEDKADTVRIVRELRFLRLLRHPNIIGVKEVLVPRNETAFHDIYIVTELMDTDLSHLIKSKTKYDDVHTRWVIFQLLRGLSFIHSADIIHRDLKPANVLLNANCDLRICDFGLARANFKNESDDTPVFWTDYVATRWYRAPELICSYFSRYSAAVDMWAAGCIWAELLRRKPLFPGANVYHSIDLITDFTGSPSAVAIGKVRNKKARDYVSLLSNKVRGDWCAMLPGIDGDGMDLMSQILAFDPDERLCAADALKHEYFAAFHNLIDDSNVLPPPLILQKDFKEWEGNKLDETAIRAKLYAEILEFHPDLVAVSEPSLPPSPEERQLLGRTVSSGSTYGDVQTQMKQVARGVAPSSRAVSLPADQTREIYRQAERLHSNSSSGSGTDSDGSEGAGVDDFTPSSSSIYAIPPPAKAKAKKMKARDKLRSLTSSPGEGAGKPAAVAAPPILVEGDGPGRHEAVLDNSSDENCILM